MNFLKRQIPLILVFSIGILFIIQFFIPHKWSRDMLTWASNWLTIIGSVTLLLGFGSLIHIHYTRMKRQIPGWGYSGVMFAGLVLSLAAGILPALLSTPADKPFLGIEGINNIAGVESGGPLFWVYMKMFNPMSATMFSILGFFMASAAFRAFRARSLEATILLIAAMLIMLGQIPLGGMISEKIPDIMAWLLAVPNTAAKRAIIFGVVLGSIATSLRIIFGIERAYLGGKE
jgi:hypothetical protein